jgi:hypothetical protein
MLGFERNITFVTWYNGPDFEALLPNQCSLKSGKGSFPAVFNTLCFTRPESEPGGDQPLGLSNPALIVSYHPFSASQNPPLLAAAVPSSTEYILVRN